MSPRKKKPEPRPKPPTYAFQAVILPHNSHAAYSLLIERPALATLPRRPPDWFRNLYEQGETRRGLPHANPRPLAGAAFVLRTDRESPDTFAECCALVGNLERDWWAVRRSALRDATRRISTQENLAQLFGPQGTP